MLGYIIVFQLLVEYQILEITKPVKQLHKAQAFFLQLSEEKLLFPVTLME